MNALVGLEVGPTGAQFGHSDPSDKRYAAKFNGTEIVRQCLAANGEYIVIWARDGDYAYYDSKVVQKASGLGNRDPLRETVTAARAHNLPVIAYCVVQQGGHYLREHPELEMRDSAGQPIGRYCFNSGYLDVMKRLVEEQLGYGIQGFHIDMVDHGFGPPYGCWCEHCQRTFQAEYGRPMPKGVTWDRDWRRMLEFRYRSSDEFEKQLTSHIRSLNPQATVDFNYHGNPPFSWEVGQRPVQHAQNGDFVTGETGMWGFGALTVGLNAEFYRAATPGRRAQVAMQRGVRMYHDQTTRPLADIRWELFTLLAHGAFVTIVDKTAFDGSLDPVAYERIGAAFSEARANRQHFGHAPIQDLGIWYSSRSRDWIGKERPTDWFPSFLGAHKAMVYEHIPWGIVLDENASLETLQRFSVVLLPNAGCLSKSDVAILDEYVNQGGNLIVTGGSGCYNRMGELQNKSKIEFLTGARFIRALDSHDNWMRFFDPFGKLRPNWPFLVKGPAVVWEPTTAKPVGELIAPHRTTRQQQGKEQADWPMSADQAVGPAVLINQHGKGTVLTLASSPDYATASEHHIVESRQLLYEAVERLHSAPRVRINAPANVEAVVTEDADNRNLRIHFLAYNSPPQSMPMKERPYVLPALIEDLPMFRVSIDLPHDVKSVQPLNAATSVQFTGGQITAQLEDVYETLVIHW